MIAAIQAGGRSQRMGEDKSWLLIDGVPMIEHVMAAVREITDDLVIVIHPENSARAQYADLADRWKARVILDEGEWRGPLAGVEISLKQCPPAENVLVLACDLPFVKAEFLRFLCERHETEKKLLTLPLDQSGRPQMLAAIYAAGCLPAISALLQEKVFKAQRLLERISAQQIPFDEYSFLAESDRLLTNINTPLEYQSLVASSKAPDPSQSG